MNVSLRIISIEPSGAGGIAHYTRFLDEAIANSGAEIELLTSSRWDYDMPNNVNIHKIFNRIRTNPVSLYLLANRLQQSSFLVHWQSASHPLMLLWVMRFIPLKKLPWVYTVHNVLPHENSEAMRTLYRKIYQRMQGLIFHNQHSQNQFERLFPNITAKKTIIPHGEYGSLGNTDLSNSLPDTPTLLFFGNIRPYKGLKHLIRAFQDVRAKIPNTKLHIAGQALEDFAPYQQQIDSLGLTQAVDHTLQYIPDEDIPSIFRNASIVVLPYEHIDQSGVLLLAMGMGKAVIATNVGGIPEVIHDGHTGILVPPRNPDALSAAILSVIENKDRLQSMGKSAREDVNKRYAWDTIAQQTIAFYQKLLDDS